MTKNTEAQRKTFVMDVDIYCVSRDQLCFPSHQYVEIDDDVAEVWMVSFQLRSGLLPEHSFSTFHSSEEEAISVIERHPVGSEMAEFPSSGDVVKKPHKQYIMSRQNLNDAAVVGNKDNTLVWETLKNSGLKDKTGGSTSQHVIDSLGDERVEDLKKRFGEHWTVAAEFEYCWLNLPHSSATYVAAACNYNTYISNDDFSAGYLLRDLEILVLGVEAEATKVLEMRKNAGEKGKEHSAKSRTTRRSALLAGMEMAAMRNPDVCALGEKSLAALGLQEAERENPELWTQGRGQTKEYLDEIRRGEAGKALHARYRALFPEKPPKGF